MDRIGALCLRAANRILQSVALSLSCFSVIQPVKDLGPGMTESVSIIERGQAMFPKMVLYRCLNSYGLAGSQQVTSYRDAGCLTIHHQLLSTLLVT